MSRSMLIIAPSLLIRHPEIEHFSSSPVLRFLFPMDDSVEIRWIEDRWKKLEEVE